MGADRVQAGPLSASGQNPYDNEAIYLDSQNAILEVSGANRTMLACRGPLAAPITAQTALTNITTAQNLISQALNAGVLNKLKRTIRIAGQLVYTSPGTTTPTITIAVTLGGTSLVSITTGAISATPSTNMPVQFEFILMVASTGATGTIESHGRVDANISANTPAAAPTPALDTNVAVSSAINLTTALTLNLTIAASSTVTSATLRQAVIEVIN